MTESLPRDDVRTHVISDALRRFGRRIVVVVLLAAAVIGAYAYLGPHTYKSTATVLIQPLSGNALSTPTSTGSQSSTVAMETEAGLVGSISVTERVNQALGTDLKPSAGGVTATVPPNSQIVQITYTASTARNAQRRAQAYALAFLDYRSDLASQSIKGQLDRLNARSDAVQAQLKQAYKDRASTNPPQDADTRVRIFTSSFSSLQTEIGSTRSLSTESGNVVTPAALPGSATGINPALLTLGGAIGGLIVAFAVAIWRVRTDDRIRAAGQVDVHGVPVLAVLPESDPAADPATDRSALLARAEALRRTRTNLLAVSPVDSVVAVGGLTPAERSLGTAADLAKALASAGYRVTLVDAAGADEPRPAWFPDGGDGLSDLLETELPAKISLPVVDGLHVLTAGSRPGSASEKYGGPRLRALLGRLRADADYVLMAIASADTAEATSLLLAADEVVFVATDGTSTHDQVVAATTDARRLGAVVLGIVVRTSSVRHRSSAGNDAGKSEEFTPSGGKTPGRSSKEEPSTKDNGPEAKPSITTARGSAADSRSDGRGSTTGRTRSDDADEPPIWEPAGHGSSNSRNRGPQRNDTRNRGDQPRGRADRGR